jgi:hypothetical protein
VDWLSSNTLDGTTLVNGFTNHIHDAAKSVTANRNLNGGSGVDDLMTPNKTFGTIHSNGTDRVLAQVGGDFKDEAAAMVVLDFEGIKNWRQVIGFKLDIDDSTNNCLDMTNSSL